MSDDLPERGTPEHTLRMLNDDNYPTAYERVMLCKVQPEPYMVKQVENLLAMLDYARNERSQLEQNIAMRQRHHIEEDLPEIKALQERADTFKAWADDYKAQRDVVQQRIEGALRYLDKCQRNGREIGGRPLRNLLSPTQETDPE